jgi:hypothetical protein
VSLLVTAAYAGAVSTAWTLDIPDLSGAGYNTAWALVNGTGLSWDVNALSGNPLPFAGGPPVDNAQIVGAGVQDSSSSFAASSIRSRLVRRRHP